jgi:hypothetical protein
VLVQRIRGGNPGHNAPSRSMRELQTGAGPNLAPEDACEHSPLSSVCFSVVALAKQETLTSSLNRDLPHAGREEEWTMVLVMLKRGILALSVGLGLGLVGAGLGWPLGMGLAEVLDMGDLDRYVATVMLSIAAGGGVGLGGGVVLALSWTSPRLAQDHRNGSAPARGHRTSCVGLRDRMRSWTE